VIKTFQLYETLDGDTPLPGVITSYVVGMPSGEVIDITDDQFINLKKQRLIRYNKGGMYFTFLDENYLMVKKLTQDPMKIQYIHYCMESFKISNYTVNADLSVDVKGDVDISGKSLQKIPIKFRQVTGNFDCSMNKLNNLTNTPNQIGGFFDCCSNQIYTLIGGPKFVAGGYYCMDNNLEDLHGFPNYCQVVFDCERNNIKTLKGMPEKIIDVRFFNVSYNRLTNLFHSSRKTMNFDCSHNTITTLTNGPKEVTGNFNCTFNRLFNLMGMPSCNKIIFNEGNEIDEVDYD